MKIEIHKRVVDYYDENGDWLDGDYRLIYESGTSVFEIDEDDVELYGSDVAAAVHYIQREGVQEASVYPIPVSIHEHTWLSGSYQHPYSGHWTETSIWVKECDDIKRSVIFREVTGHYTTAAA